MPLKTAKTTRAPASTVEAYIAARRSRALPVILDLGCGIKKVPGAFGIDITRLPGVDLTHDLEDVPYPLPESCVDVIHLNHVLEHLENPLRILEEVWRIARHNALVFIRTPHYSGTYAWIDPTHRRTFSARSFHYFGENGYSYYTSARFHVVSVRLKYLAEEKIWPWPHRAWGRLVQWFLDRHPTFGERFLCYLIGGIDELHVTLAPVKNQNGGMRRTGAQRRGTFPPTG
jgi:SAM-dependent methyltransferase